jgi:Arylsulfotransferase (ASST).
MNGRVVKTWDAGSTPSSIAYLLENGNLIRAGLATNPPFGTTAGGGGKMQEFNWNGDLVWDFTFGTATATQHHDFTRLPNGNVLMVVKEKKTSAEAIAAGRIPSTVQGTEVQPDSVIEIKPMGKTGGEVVWEWHLWDHLIQDADKDKANFGDVGAHPERVDINYNVVAGQRANADWTHFNAVSYNAELDQVLVSLATSARSGFSITAPQRVKPPGIPGARAAKAEIFCIDGETRECIVPEQSRISGCTASTMPTGFPVASRVPVTC